MNKIVWSIFVKSQVTELLLNSNFVAELLKINLALHGKPLSLVIITLQNIKLYCNVNKVLDHPSSISCPCSVFSPLSSVHSPVHCSLSWVLHAGSCILCLGSGSFILGPMSLILAVPKFLQNNTNCVWQFSTLYLGPNCAIIFGRSKVKSAFEPCGESCQSLPWFP